VLLLYANICSYIEQKTGNMGVRQPKRLSTATCESIYNKQKATYVGWKILHMWHLIPRIVSALLTTKISDLVIHSARITRSLMLFHYSLLLLILSLLQEADFLKNT
jgi:hypothetical protein